jgi:S1-C subfamily serine protease
VLLAVVAGVVVVRSSGSSNSSAAVTDSAVSKGNSSVGTTPVEPSTSVVVGNSEWDTVARSVVYIEATGSRCGWTGSGSIVGDGSYVLTNQHVSGDGECDLTVWLTDSTTAVPTKYVRAEVVESDSSRDLAVIQMRDSDGQPFIDSSRTPMKFSTSLPKLGDKLTILGYPGIGGSTITLTSGDFSGIDKSETFEYLKTTANMNPGVSGGAAFNAKGELVGIPTAGRGAEIACDNQSDCVANGSTIGLLRPVALAQDVLAKAVR